MDPPDGGVGAVHRAGLRSLHVQPVEAVDVVGHVHIVAGVGSGGEQRRGLALRQLLDQPTGYGDQSPKLFWMFFGKTPAAMTTTTQSS